MKQNNNLHNGRPESLDLTAWIDWAESIDDNPCGPNASESENSCDQYGIKLVSVDYVLELLQQVREMKIDTEDYLRLLNNPIKME